MSDDDILLVRFRANSDQYRRELDRARTYGGKRFRDMQKDAEQSASGIDKAMGTAFKTLGSFGKGLLGGIAGGLAIGGIDQILSNTRELAKSYADIGNEARRAGLSSKAFQELKFAAEQNRVPVDALVDGMKELRIRADEFYTDGTGAGADAFKRLGYSADDLKRRLQNPSEALVDIISRLRTLDNEAQKRLLEDIFGGEGGEQFAQFIDRGADSIRKTIKEANDLGLVIDDQMIARADEFDRKWSAAANSFGTYWQEAFMSVAFLADDFLDRFNKIDEQTTRNVQSALVASYKKLEDAKKRLGELNEEKVAFPDDVNLDLNIEQQTKLVEELTGETMRLRDILDRRNGYSENFIYKTGEDAKGATSPVNGLNSALNGTGAAGKNALAGIKSYTDAIRALKDEVPELAKSLANLDAKAKIEAVYQKAIVDSRGQREIALANEMRGKALSALSLKSATDDPSTYLSAILAKGKGADSITGMQSAFREKLAKMIASMPDDMKGAVTVNSGFRDIARQQQLWLEALKKYGSPEAARKWVAPPGNSQHNKGNAADLGYGSDRAREWVHANASNFGLSFPLSNENWHIEDADARQKQTADEIDKLTQAATRQADAYSQITGSARQYVSTQNMEQQALGMTAQRAAALRYEQDMLNEAQRAGIALTPQQRQEIAALAQGMATAETSFDALREKQAEAQQTARFFGEGMTDALTGIITGTMTAQDALQQLLSTLVKATLQAALMGEGPLASLFGMAPKAGGGSSGGGIGFGGIFGSLLGSLFGLAEGGHVRGPGTGTSDSIPVRLSNGEFVVNAAATKKNRAVLEAINTGKIASFAKGGYAGEAPMPRMPVRNVGTSKQAPVAPTISIASNVTVNASGGTPEQNDDLVAKVGKQVENQMRSVVQQELQKASRPGGYLQRR